jgi:hypothetical protein
LFSFFLSSSFFFLQLLISFCPYGKTLVVLEKSFFFYQIVLRWSNSGGEINILDDATKTHLRFKI